MLTMGETSAYGLHAAMLLNDDGLVESVYLHSFRSLTHDEDLPR